MARVADYIRTHRTALLHLSQRFFVAARVRRNLTTMPPSVVGKFATHALETFDMRRSIELVPAEVGLDSLHCSCAVRFHRFQRFSMQVDVLCQLRRVATGTGACTINRPLITMHD